MRYAMRMLLMFYMERTKSIMDWVQERICDDKEAMGRCAYHTYIHMSAHSCRGIKI